VSVSVRLKGVDAPELFRPQCEGVRALARKAKSIVGALIGGGVLLREIEHDKYGGRVVARLETAGGVDIGAALLAERLATKIGTPDSWRL
jgi:endonuclease YncB( thermonuclease family)